MCGLYYFYNLSEKIFLIMNLLVLRIVFVVGLIKVIDKILKIVY